jgi:hypothetical protein
MVLAAYLKPVIIVSTINGDCDAQTTTKPKGIGAIMGG